MLHKQRIIPKLEIYNSCPSFVFWLDNHWLGNKVATSLFLEFPHHKHCFLALSIFSITPFGSLMVDMA
jgi:hypothetical protein